jgi:hypothetical protein
MVMNLSKLSLYQLKAYRNWLEKEEAEFLRTEPESVIFNTKHSARKGWYSSEWDLTDGYINKYESREVYDEMELKANKFLDSQPVTITFIKEPESTISLLDQIKNSLNDFREGLSK